MFYYLISIFLGMSLSYFLTYKIFVEPAIKLNEMLYDYINEKEFHSRIVKLCPRNIKRCDRCIYTAFVDNPDLIKPCEKEYSKYE